MRGASTMREYYEGVLLGSTMKEHYEGREYYEGVL